MKFPLSASPGNRLGVTREWVLGGYRNFGKLITFHFFKIYNYMNIIDDKFL